MARVLQRTRDNARTESAHHIAQVLPSSDSLNENASVFLVSVAILSSMTHCVCSGATPLGIRLSRVKPVLDDVRTRICAAPHAHSAIALTPPPPPVSLRRLPLRAVHEDTAALCAAATRAVRRSLARSFGASRCLTHLVTAITANFEELGVLRGVIEGRSERASFRSAVLAFQPLSDRSVDEIDLMMDEISVKMQTRV